MKNNKYIITIYDVKFDIIYFGYPTLIDGMPKKQVRPIKKYYGNDYVILDTTHSLINVVIGNNPITIHKHIKYLCKKKIYFLYKAMIKLNADKYYQKKIQTIMENYQTFTKQLKSLMNNE